MRTWPGGWRKTPKGWARGSVRTGDYEWREDEPPGAATPQSHVIDLENLEGRIRDGVEVYQNVFLGRVAWEWQVDEDDGTPIRALKFKLLDRRQRVVGGGSTWFYPHSGEAHHHMLDVTPLNQGAGIGRGLFSLQDQAYAAAGVRVSSLIAMEIGRYAWALYGYDFVPNEPENRAFIAQVRHNMAVLLGPSGWGHFTSEAAAAEHVKKAPLAHAWELAAYRHEGVPVGKWAILGMDGDEPPEEVEQAAERLRDTGEWHGVRVLRPDSMGFQIGHRYARGHGMNKASKVLTHARGLVARRRIPAAHHAALRSLVQDG